MTKFAPHMPQTMGKFFLGIILLIRATLVKIMDADVKLNLSSIRTNTATSEQHRYS